MGGILTLGHKLTVTQCAISFDFSIHNNREKHTVFLILSVSLTAVHL